MGIFKGNPSMLKHPAKFLYDYILTFLINSFPFLFGMGSSSMTLIAKKKFFPNQIFRYINEFTFQTNKLLGENNMKLTWKGPYHRHDAATSASKISEYFI